MRFLQPSALCVSLLVTTACGADPLDIYVGAGAGRSVLNQDAFQVDSHVTGWKILAGWRPISMLGAEVEYANFGSKNVSYPLEGQQISTKEHATAVFAVGYLPVPEPSLDPYGVDLYAKAGAARTQASTTVIQSCPACPTGFSTAPTTSVIDTTSTRFAWGAGAQLKFGLPAVRLEYERFNGSQGSDSLLSLVLTANF